MDRQQLRTTVAEVLDEMREHPIPLGVSNRHIYLCIEGYGRLFPNHLISEERGLLQPGQYIVEQTVMLVGLKGRLKNVCLLGPLCSTNQVEISRIGAHMLEIAALLRVSGNIQGAPGIRLVNPFAKLDLASGVIVAQRHIHMSSLDALIPWVSHGDRVSAAINDGEHRLVFDNVAVRVSPDTRLEIHTDINETNAAGANNPQASITPIAS